MIWYLDVIRLFGLSSRFDIENSKVNGPRALQTNDILFLSLEDVGNRNRTRSTYGTCAFVTPPSGTEPVLILRQLMSVCRHRIQMH